MKNHDSPLRIFIGYDDVEAVSFHVLAHSIAARSSMPVTITPLMSRTLASVFSRPRSASQASDFSFTRFLVPYLSDYDGVSIFMDCDMLMQTDIVGIAEHTMSNRGAAVFCCKHDYTPRETTKFLGNAQLAYPRKNWSSFMVFRNNRCRTLTPEYVNTASAADLHRFAWVSDGDIGSLPLEWNYLVGEDNQSAEPPNNIHWTLGGPWFPDYANAPYSGLWRAELDSMLKPLIKV